MKNNKFFLIVFICFFNSFNIYAKPIIPECPVANAKVYNCSSKIKKIKINFSNWIIKNNQNENIYFELFGYNEKTNQWTSLTVFNLKDKYELEISENKLKTIAISASKNCEDFKITFENNSGSVAGFIKEAYLVQELEEKTVCNNRTHKISSVTTKSYDITENSRTYECKIIILYDNKEIIAFKSNKNITNAIDIFLNDENIIFMTKFDDNFLFKNDTLISKGKNLEFIGFSNGDVYYSKEACIYKNENLLYGFLTKYKVFFKNDNIYYVDILDSKNVIIYKNDLPLKTLSKNLKEYAVGYNDEIAYTLIENNGDVVLYKNDMLYAKATGSNIIMNPTYSPDGKKFYFIEGKTRGGYYNAYYLYGDFPIPPTTGFTLVGNFKFSPNSKYIATYVEDLQAKKWYILSGKILGPFDYTSEDYHFSDDSKTFFYRYYDTKIKKWIDAEENLD